MTNSRKKNSSVIINDGDREYVSQKTIVVFGTVRGGTSMVSGVLRGHGVFMGDNLGNNHEDPIFVSRNKNKIRETIQLRNKDHDVWGWKYPECSVYIDDIWRNLRNPYLICVFRDFAAVTSAQMRWHGKGPIRALNDLMIDTFRNISFLSRVGCPRMLVSYEKAVNHPEIFVREITKFCQLSDNPSFNYREFMKPESYKEIDEHISPKS